MQPPRQRSSSQRSSACAALIGDVVGSRLERDQSRLFARVEKTLQIVRERIPAKQPLAMTIGDEFQAVYATLEDALFATTLLRLNALPSIDLRFGVGWGKITITRGKTPLGQTGEGWWRAREAIRTVSERSTSSRWPPSLRTLVVDVDERRAALLNSFLVCRDHILASLDEKDARITLGLFAGERQSDLADALGLPQSSISRRQRENGPAALFRAHEILTEQITARGPDVTG